MAVDSTGLDTARYEPSGSTAAVTTPPIDVTPPTAHDVARRSAASQEVHRRGFSLRTLEALRNPLFRLLYIGNLAQFASMQMQMLVRGILVYDLTGSFAALGFVSLANALPGLICAPFGGMIADRLPRKSVIQWMQGFNAVNALVLAVLAGGGMLRIEHLMVSAVLQGAANSMMMPSRQSIISDLVGREKLMNAVALNTSAQNIMQLVGPGLGAALLTFLNASAVFYVMAGLYLFAMACTARLPKRPLFAYVATEGKGKRSGLRDIWAGLQYVAAEPTIRTLIAVNFLIVLVSMPYTMMLPGYVRDVLDKGSAEQGVLMSVTGVGAVFGSLIVASLPSANRGRTLLIVALILGVSLLAFASSSNYLVTLPIMLAVGAASATRMSLGQVLIQSYSADEYRGRVMAVWFMQFSLVALGTFGVGILSEWFGPQLTIGGMAGILVVVALMALLFVPRMRNMQ